MCIVEQVDKLIIDMKQLIEDLNTTDACVIDLEQLKELKESITPFTKELIVIIKDIENSTKD